MPIALAAVVHDPWPRLLPFFVQRAADLAAPYHHTVVVLTPGTSPAWEVSSLAPSVALFRSSVDDVGHNRREALALASALPVDAVHSCDLDRVLHWLALHPAELAAVLVSLPAHPYTVLGRPDAAMLSHPLSQRLPEIATNEAVSAVLGTPLDVTSGSCAMQPRVARLILERSIARGVSTDGEWPAIASRQLARDLHVIAVDGLSFETADFYSDEIQAAGGLAAWIHARYDTLDSRLRRALRRPRNPPGSSSRHHPRARLTPPSLLAPIPLPLSPSLHLPVSPSRHLSLSPSLPWPRSSETFASPLE